MTDLQFIYAIIAVLAVWLVYRLWRRGRIQTAPLSPEAQAPALGVTPLSKEAPPVRASVDSFPEPALQFGPRLWKSEENTVPRVEPDQVPTADKSDYVFGPLTPVFAALLPESETRRATVKRELMTAGYYQPHAWQNLAALRYLGIIVPLVLIGLLIVLAPQQLEAAAVALLLFLPAMGWAVPRLVVRNQGRERLGEIERAMPDMLDMLNMCVSQGMTVPESLERISQELRPVYPALSQELTIVVEQSHVGSLQQTLENFAERIDLPDVHSFTTLMTQTERMGTSVSQALTDYSDNMRESLRQRADEKANQATFKLLFPTVTCLMPAVFLFLLGPAIIQLSDFFIGGGSDVLGNSAQQVEQLNRRE